MFAKHSRPSRVRRFLHPLERSLGLENEIPGAEVVDALHRWALGLPWVLELSRPPGDDAGRRYAIDCPPLECRSVWLWVGPIEGSDSVFELNVVLPHDLAHRGAPSAGRCLSPTSTEIGASSRWPCPCAPLSTVPSRLCSRSRTTPPFARRGLRPPPERLITPSRAIGVVQGITARRPAAERASYAHA